jgi:hypothetical protein
MLHGSVRPRILKMTSANQRVRQKERLTEEVNSLIDSYAGFPFEIPEEGGLDEVDGVSKERLGREAGLMKAVDGELQTQGESCQSTRLPEA